MRRLRHPIITVPRSLISLCPITDFAISVLGNFLYSSFIFLLSLFVLTWVKITIIWQRLLVEMHSAAIVGVYIARNGAYFFGPTCPFLAVCAAITKATVLQWVFSQYVYVMYRILIDWEVRELNLLIIELCNYLSCALSTPVSL